MVQLLWDDKDLLTVFRLMYCLVDRLLNSHMNLLSTRQIAIQHDCLADEPELAAIHVMVPKILLCCTASFAAINQISLCLWKKLWRHCLQFHGIIFEDEVVGVIYSTFLL